MDTNTAPQPGTNPTPSGASYVDAYQPPPSILPNQPDQQAAQTPQPQSQVPTDPSQSSPAAPFASPLEPNQPMMSDQTEQAPQQTAQPAAAETTGSETSTSEAIEDQNIFFMLGVTDGTPEQREAFLDELQQVIWEDFLENDVKLLVTSEELTAVQGMIANRESKDLEKQEEIIVYLEKLIPDLEDIMLEKALELKVDMVKERVQALRSYYADKADKIARIDQAEQLMQENKWYSAAHVLNSLSL